MFRANIYSLEPLQSHEREEINTGVEMVAAYMGQTAVSNSKLIRVPTNRLGQVDPQKANFQKLDKMVELHVMALPLVSGVTHETQLGIAGIGRGWAYVDPIKVTSGLMLRSVSAHEVAHALGFVNPESKQHNPASTCHCSDPACIMYRSREFTPVTVARPKPRGLKAAAKQFMRELWPQVEHTHADSQYDFCLACKLDIRDQGEANLTQLRLKRLAPGARIK